MVLLLADHGLQSIFLQEILGVRQRKFGEGSECFRELRGWRRIITTHGTDDRRRGDRLWDLEFHRDGTMNRRDALFWEARSDCGVLAFCFAEDRARWISGMDDDEQNLLTHC